MKWNALNGQCLKHIRSQNGCPESEWVPGRTVKTIVNGRETFVAVFETEELAQEEASMANIHPDNLHLYEDTVREIV